MVVFVDGGGVGGGVVDRLRQLGVDVIEVQFGGAARDARKYLNRRAEIWGAMRDWLAVGCIERDETLATDLTSVEYQFTLKDQIQLERKEDMKKRGLASPDDGDALALTFAEPVPEYPRTAGPVATAGRRVEHDPYATMR